MNRKKFVSSSLADLQTRNDVPHLASQSPNPLLILKNESCPPRRLDYEEEEEEETGLTIEDSKADPVLELKQFKLELRATLQTDLMRLPDVQELIILNFHKLRLLQEAIFENMTLNELFGCDTSSSSTTLTTPTTTTMSSSSIKYGANHHMGGTSLSHLPPSLLLSAPEFHEVLLKNIESLPVWRAILERAAHEQDASIYSVLSSTSQATVFLNTVFRHSSSSPNLPSIPNNLSKMLLSIPSFQDRMALGFCGLSSLSPEVCSLLEDHEKVLHEVEHIVLEYEGPLPHLKTLLIDHYHLQQNKLIHHIPRWMKDNPFVLSGYRPEFHSWWRCFRSLFYVHNESVNIYSHLLGALLFLALAVYTAIILDEHWADHFMFALFFLGAMTCLICSSVFHTFYVHSCKVGTFLNRLDYAGITALISGSTMPVIYLCFYCNLAWRVVYLLMATIFGVICLYASFSDSYREPQYKWVRVVLFIGLSATVFIPCVHYGIENSFSDLVDLVDVFWILYISCPLYLVGAAIYVLKFPERLFPGKFDIWGSSHQWWHLFVVAAAICHMIGLYHMFEWRIYSYPCGIRS